MIIALAIVILTGVVKTPIKKLASKSSKSKKITRFITFLPIVIGFMLTVLFTYLTHYKVVFEQTFFSQWLSAVSLSLAIYAFWEKFVPNERKILSESEIQATNKIVNELKTKLIDSDDFSDKVNDTEADQTLKHRKIILTNNKKIK